MRTAAALATIAFGILSAAPTASAADATRSVEIVRQAIARGHGAVCSLDNIPVARDGYYRCLDIGPYRFVEEYGRMRGFVVTEGSAPFPILTTEGGRAAFTTQGAWMQDLPTRVSMWWADEGHGGRTAREAQDDYSRRIRDAQSAVEAYLARENPPPVEVPAAAAPPTLYSPEAGAYPIPAQPLPQQTAPLHPQQTTPIPSGMPPSPGVLIAPGVVGYPQQ